MIYTVEFFSRKRGEEIKIAVDAPSMNAAAKCILHCFREEGCAIRSVKVTPDAAPKFRVN